MKKLGIMVLAVLVAVAFSAEAFAALSTSCNSDRSCGVCAKQPCSACGKNSCTSCVKCPPKPCMPNDKCGSCMSCRTCARPCVTCPKPCAPCAKPVCMEYKRDVLGNRVPVYTNLEGDALNDTATGYESGIISGQ